MESQRPSDGHAAPSFLTLLLFAVAYLILLEFSLLFGFGPDSISIFWPANGFLVGFMLGLPRRWLLPVFAFAFAVDVAGNLLHGKLPSAAIGFSLANMAESATALFLILKLPGREGFLGNLAGTVRFFLFVALGGAACGAVLGSLTALLAFGADPVESFLTWLLVDGAGLAVVTPAFLSWKQRDMAWDVNKSRHLEFASCAAISLFLGYISFGRPEWIAPRLGYPLPYTTFPFLMWAALRFGARGAATLHLGVYMLAAWYTARGQGPFLSGQPLGSGLVVSLQLFPYAAAFCSLVPAVLIRTLMGAEAALRSRESRYGSLWKSKLVGIYVTDLKGVLVEANDTFLGLMGYSREELQAGRLSVRDMATPEYLARMAGSHEKFERDGMLGPFEREWVRKDGRKLISLAYAAKMEEPDRALCMVMDMEELKQTQEQLRLRESRYRDLLSNSMLGIFVTDLRGKFLEANDTFLGMIKRTRAELEAGLISSAEMVTPEYLTGAEERRSQFQREGRMGPYDREWILADGSRLNTLFFATRMEGTGHALCMAFDTNELKRTKLELRAIESRFKKLFDANILGVGVVNEMQVFEEANSAFLELTGYSRLDLETAKVTTYALKAAQSQAEIQATLDQTGATGKMAPQETVWMRKDGRRIPIFRGVAKLDESNRWMVVAIDLSRLKQTQLDLETAIAAAESANRAKSDFLAHMSHEIRTPLNGVLGMLSLLAETNLDPEQQSYARTSQESGSHLLCLINQVLDFSKIEQGHLELDHVPFALDAVVEGALSSVVEAAQKKGIDLVARLSPDLPKRYSGDAMRLQQVLLNLLGNAVKFSDRGEVRLSARLAGPHGAGVRLEFEVQDQGPGIAPQVQASLFQPFRQGDNTLSRKVGGTGLGLAISRELVRKMGGEIFLESTPGAGCLFRFSIVLEPEQEPEPSPASSRPHSGPAVWILEPGPEHLAQLREFLSGWGFQVLAAANGSEMMAMVADAIVADKPPELAILGVPPGATGTEWAEQMLESAKRLGVPALCSLPFLSKAQGAELIRAGAAAILTKPFRASDVYNVIRSLLPHWLPGEDAFAPGVKAGKEAAAPVPDWIQAPRILVVDDHPVNLTVASAMLRKLGCASDTAPDGPAAMAAVAGKAYDLIFMDCQMPGMDGFETTRRLRAGEAGKRHTPIVALTAHAVSGVREKCLAEGMDDYISKPFTAGDIARVMRKWIPGSGAGSQSAESVRDDAAAPSLDARRADLVDESRLGSLEDGTPQGSDRTRKLVALFRETTRKSLESIRAGQRDGNAPALAKALHRLKGSCATLGATAMAAHLAAMETRLEDDGAAALSRDVDSLDSLFALTDEAFRSRNYA